jgi:hypothetical protein
MPHHIAAKSIAMEMRRPYLVAYMGQAKKALQDPTLPERQRQRLQQRIERIRADITSHNESQE